MSSTARVFLRGAFLSAALAMTAVSSFGQSAAQGSWSMVAPMTIYRGEIGAIDVNGKIYVAGGAIPGADAAPLFQEFDPATRKWRDLAPLPIATSHPGVAALNGKVYVAGGFTMNVHKNPLALFAEYDIATNTWRDLPPLPQPLGSVGLIAFGGKVHMIGGRKPDGSTVPDHYVFDPKTSQWTMAARLPVARDHIGLAMIDGALHVFGGRLNATVDNVGLHDVYDAKTDSWRSLAPMPTPRSSGAATAYRGLLVYHGGECKDAAKRITFDEFEAYDPKTDTWRALAKAPTGLHAHAAVTVGDTAYFIGGSAGCGGDNPSTSVYGFKLQ
jgi:N-acetylneuraminic acid mutarotase